MMLVAGILILVFIGSYIVAVYCQAKSHVDTAPKEELHLCPVHGAIPMRAMMMIDTQDYEFSYDTGEVVNGKFPYCPRCFETRIEEARKHYDKD
jgi:formate dehydrogenase maturation protein FdhE